MTPPRFAILVVVTAVLLPISPNVSATVTTPVNTFEMQPAVNVLPANSQGTVRTGEEVRWISMRTPLANHRKVDCGCLYYDWWYDTGGLWVHAPRHYIEARAGLSPSAWSAI